MNLKTVTFTHKRDIDGMGGAILSKLAFNTKEIYYCDYSDFISQFLEFISNKDINEYDKIFILDLSIKEVEQEFIKQIENNEILKNKLVFLDHHSDSLHLNKYSWAKVELKNLKGELTCATCLFADWLESEKFLDINMSIYNLIEEIRQYDTWEWVKNKNKIPNYINYIFEFYGIEDFVEIFTQKLIDKNYSLTDMEKRIAYSKEKEIQNYIEYKIKTLICKNINNYECAIIFSDFYRNDISEYIRNDERYNNIDIVIIIGDSLSFRSNKSNINVANFASNFNNGGGGFHSAGANITQEQRNKMIEILLK